MRGGRNLIEEGKSYSKFVVFLLKDEEYMVSVHQVNSIERMMPFTRVPGVDSFIKGVVNLRGKVTPVVDLRERFNMKAEEYRNETRILMITIGDVDVGLIVDAAYDVIDISDEDMQPPPKVIGDLPTEFIESVAKLEERLLIQLNLKKVLSVEEVQELERIEQKNI
ncbi:chemotaxis protein CheW [Halobacillus sp. KCTC 3957]|uniref:Chemotaxis protein CheW n=1 Tax=Halobacillus yeomjeoni TaxID=311194 RepID=A0A931HTV7_9BACI|nr:chemotaxis protein CheW [Halobacillus yeomjeoni]MBH0229294.1 chemotaxis protein CheW [Halobacillus yeomjeoni]